ncbi:MAG: protein phosphatase CheZ [Alphaproteobacteria bacterium]|nr:protein phosphatase CheZ [Alphaproteobacteria bacterium]
MTNGATMNMGDFERIAEALRATPLGRAFLAEHARQSQAVSAAHVEGMFGELRQLLADRAQGGAQLGVMRRELQELAEHIRKTRAEIAALRPKDISANRIMAASEELDAIISATERATGDILNAAEQIGELCRSKAAHESIEALSFEIISACSFQDITGQRISKVVNTLRYIEQRLASMIEIWDAASEHRVEGDPHLFDPTDTRPDAHLLHGPALEGAGLQQDDIDQLLQSMENGAPRSAAE